MYIRPRLKRPCKRCGKTFMPTGRDCRICDKCNKTIYLDGRLRRLKLKYCKCGHTELHHNLVGIKKREVSGNTLGKGYEKRYEGKIVCDVKWCKCKKYEEEKDESNTD